VRRGREGGDICLLTNVGLSGPLSQWLRIRLQPIRASSLMIHGSHAIPGSVITAFSPSAIR
jgi:hypothetical protein